MALGVFQIKAIKTCVNRATRQVAKQSLILEPANGARIKKGLKSG